MPGRRSSQLTRMPFEEHVRQATEEHIGQDGEVYVERSDEGEVDSVLVQVTLREAFPVAESVRVQHELRNLCQRLFPQGGRSRCCAVVEHFGERNFVSRW